MRFSTLRTLSLLLICPVLFSCTKKAHENSIADNAEIKAFVSYFFIPDSSLLKNETEDFSLHAQYAENLADTGNICTTDNLSNRTKDYRLEFTPNFLFETINGRTIVAAADPDAFVDLCDIKNKKVFRVRGTGTEGSIYGTFWLSDYAFVVYGIESDKGFVDVFDIRAKINTGYTIDKAKKKAVADSDAFLIAKYCQEKRFK